MILSQIVAISDNYAIGKDNKLLWHHPEDLKYFKAHTVDKIMIMGRKTFESLGRPLPKRFHIVISRTKQQHESPAVVFVTSIDEALKAAQEKLKQPEHLYKPEVMIIGGAEIYRQTLKQCDRLYISRITGQFEADAFYPEQFSDGFQLKSTQKAETTDEVHFEVWEKPSIS